MFLFFVIGGVGGAEERPRIIELAGKGTGRAFHFSFLISQVRVDVLHSSRFVDTVSHSLLFSVLFP